MTLPLKSPANDPQDVKTRVQVDLSPAHMARLNWLMDVCDIETRKDLVNTALSVFEWAVRETVKGKTVAAVDHANHSITELGLPALMDAARNALARKTLREETLAEVQ